jgi:hypothetical protein
MSVTTTADEHIEKANQHLKEAKQHYLQSIDINTWGSDDLNHAVILKRILKIEEIIGRWSKE